MEKFKKFFSNKENSILFFISIMLGLNSFFLVAKNTGNFPFIRKTEDLYFLFLAYFILIVSAAGTISFFNKQLKIKNIIKRLVLIFLPTQAILVWGFQIMQCSSNNTTCFLLNQILPLASILYFILIAYLLVDYRKKESIEPEVKKRILFSNFKKWDRKIIFIILAVFCINLAFGTYHLAESARVDEALWTFGRIPKFWSNMADGKLEKTRISDKPGITVALVSGIGMLFENPLEYKNTRWQGENAKKSILDMNRVFRLPIMLFNAFALFIFYFLISKLLDKKTAILSVILIGLSPILLGISTIINPDSLLWIFVPFSILSYLIYRKSGENSYLYWSGIFLGLSLLTKYVANLLYVFFFALIFLEYIFQEKTIETTAAYLKKSLIDYFIMTFFSLLAFAALLPATWTDAGKILEATIFSQAFEKVWPVFLGLLVLIIADITLAKAKVMSFILDFFAKHKKAFSVLIFSIFLFFILYTLTNVYSGMKLADFEAILASPKSSYSFSGFLSIMGGNFYSLLFGILPLALFSLIFISVKNTFEKNKNINIEKSTFLFLTIFILLYYFASTISNVSATVRYQIIIYPLALIIAAIGLKQIIEIEKIKKYIPEYLAYFLIIVFSVISLNSIKPFYFTYASSLLPERYVLNLKDMGDGSYEAAQYINSKPGAENMYIWTDKDGVCKFFLGRCTSSLDYKRYMTEGVKFDYYVVSSGREAKNVRAVLAKKSMRPDYLIRFDKLYSFESTDFEINFGNRKNNFVKVIKADKIDLSYDRLLDKQFKK